MELHEAAERFVEWLDSQVTDAGRGTSVSELNVDPDGSFWLGRLAPEKAVIERGLGERGERLDPCAMGIRAIIGMDPPWTFQVHVRARAWIRFDNHWIKSDEINETVDVNVRADTPADYELAREQLSIAFARVVGVPGHAALLRLEVRPTMNGETEVTILVVNVSPMEHKDLTDMNLYEVELEAAGLETVPFELETLPDSFRYDRRVEAYGVNCGVERSGPTNLRTTDTIVATRGRPTYWNVSDPEPDLSFKRLATEPLPPLQELLDSLSGWADRVWSDSVLDSRALVERWSTEMRAQAQVEAREFRAELERLRSGLELLSDTDSDIYRAFKLMNRSIAHSSHGRYDGWRPFQIGFLLANLKSLVANDAEADQDIVDVIWFATGGGKTETYLALLVMASFLDRLRGKASGITAWSRFPLRMLSLQQTQRFADAMAGAELVRLAEGINGDPFSVGFFVGARGTPNRINMSPQYDWQPDPDDDDMPARYQVLTSCPFCFQESVEMAFDRINWCLQHRCTNTACGWDGDRLPFYIVDDEIYRYLPTVVVGTLDKAALVALQASMRGFIGPPHGICERPGHGFTYAPRSSRPSGCLVPGCPGKRHLIAERGLFGPSFRLQDELHLLKDGLGAVDAHYEALLDHLQEQLTGTKPKILASSATLAGYGHQARVLYSRDARVFPLPGPSVDQDFWTAESSEPARRYVAVAPRGQTIEYTIDKLATNIQQAVRRLIDDPVSVCAEAGIDPAHSSDLVSLYGTNVIYGNSLRDLDAVMRSTETQVSVNGALNTAPLTGRTPLDEVRQTLSRLQYPEQDFEDRLHLVGASSMMSHGVDIDRLNVMLMVGLPLTAAEFIQTTSRVGRRWPGITYVIHKIGRERDAALYRSFETFVRHGDRFVEPIPVTRRSRRVLERTLPGFELARILAVHEPRSKRSLATISALRQYFDDRGIDAAVELLELVAGLKLTGALDDQLVADTERWIGEFFHNLFHPAGEMMFPSDLCPNGGRPMMSLRDVEEQAPIVGLLG